MSRSTKEKLERVLVLCVDRDDDIGVKAKIKTPVLGRKENLNAAVNLALQDPEEPDANAIFGAIRIFDSLTETSESKENCQIATISGSDLGGVGADRKLVSQLNQVLKEFSASDVILVTDGYADEAVLPLVQSRVPVTSVRRIVVKHSEFIEETAAIFSRYLKMLWQNPRYSRIALGLPGILLIVLGILSVAGVQPTHLGIAFLIVVGAVFVVKGFGMDKVARGFYKWVREYSPPPLPTQIANFAAIFGVLLIGIGCYQAGAAVASSPTIQPLPADIGQWITVLPRLVGEFISQSIALVVFGVCVILSGRATRWFFKRDPRLLRTIVIVVTCAWSWQIFYQASRILIDPTLAYTGLIAAIVTGILLTVGAVLITFLLHRRFAGFFREKETEVEEFKEG
jgi:putative membrane protein